MEPGQLLVISESDSCTASEDLATTKEQKPHENLKTAYVRHKKVPSVAQVEIPKTYRVQKGDTLYSITRRFTKLSLKELMKINNLKNKNIKPGQQLIVG